MYLYMTIICQWNLECHGNSHPYRSHVSDHDHLFASVLLYSMLHDITNSFLQINDGFTTFRSVVNGVFFPLLKANRVLFLYLLKREPLPNTKTTLLQLI